MPSSINIINKIKEVYKIMDGFIIEKMTIKKLNIRFYLSDFLIITGYLILMGMALMSASSLNN